MEKTFGLLKLRFEIFLHDYRWSLRHFMPLFILGCVATNFILIHDDELSVEEKEGINDIIFTENRNMESTILNFDFNSIEETFPEVRINDDNSHSILINSETERVFWEGRNRRVRDPHPTFNSQNFNGINNIGISNIGNRNTPLITILHNLTQQFTILSNYLINNGDNNRNNNYGITIEIIIIISELFHY